MTTSPEEIKKIWAENLFKASEAIIMGALTGKSIPQETITVELVLALPLVEALRNSAKACNMDEKEFFTQIAASTFKEGMTLKTQDPAGTSVHPNLNQIASLNNPTESMDKIGDLMGDFSGKMKQMQEMLGQFKGLESMLSGGK